MKLLGRAARDGWRTPFSSEKRRTRNNETVIWHNEVLAELAEEQTEIELDAELKALEAKRNARLKWVTDIIEGNDAK